MSRAGVVVKVEPGSTDSPSSVAGLGGPKTQPLKVKQAAEVGLPLAECDRSKAPESLDESCDWGCYRNNTDIFYAKVRACDPIPQWAADDRAFSRLLLTQCHTAPSHWTPLRNAMPCQCMACHAIQCHAMPTHAMACHAMP